MGLFLFAAVLSSERRAPVRLPAPLQDGGETVRRGLLKRGGMKLRQITGNKLLVRALKEEGVDTIFGYPGACTIDISDELYKQDDIRVILPRHEQALVHEAAAW